MELIEMELRHAVAYVNDAVIPQVRRESICAMRTVAETLRDLADRIEHAPNRPQASRRIRAPDDSKMPFAESRTTVRAGAGVRAGVGVAGDRGLRTS
jgi:hypothetical protein